MMDGWMDDGWMDGWMMDGWMESWMMDRWVDKTAWGSIHTVEYYTAMKRREGLTQDTTWMDLKHTMLSETSRHRRIHGV